MQMNNTAIMILFKDLQHNISSKVLMIIVSKKNKILTAISCNHITQQGQQELEGIMRKLHLDT